jgi:hypothetical protein
MTHVANEVEMSGVAKRRFKARPTFTEIDLSGDPGVDHPLQGPIDGGAADTSVFSANQIAEIVRAQMSLLAEKDVENAVAFCGTFPAGRTEAGKIQGRSIRR